MSIVQMLFSAKGRIRRSQYWLWAIGLAIFFLLIEFTGHHFITGHPPGDFLKDMAGWLSFKPEPFNLFMFGVMTLRIWPGICLSAKRWHDRGKTGWIAGIIVAVSIVLTAAEAYFGPKGTHLSWPIYAVSALIGLGIGIWVLVECGCLDGTRGPNAYGPSPKGIDGAADVF